MPLQSNSPLWRLFMNDKDLHSPGEIRRRQFLKLGALAAGFSTMSVFAPVLNASENCSPPIPSGPFNGSTCPFPIPWLDKNGNHNQAPKANVEMSNIYHFKGKIARCAGFTGMGTD